MAPDWRNVLGGSGLTYWFCRSWGHYTRFRPVWTEFREIVKVAGYIGLCFVLLLFAFKTEFSRLWLGFFVVLLVVFIPTARSFSRSVMVKLGWWYKSTYVVGTGDNAVMTAAALESDSALGHRVDGFVALDDPESSMAYILGKPVLTSFPDESFISKRNERPCFVFAFDSLKDMDRHKAVVNRYIASSPFSTISPPIKGLPLYGAEILTVFKQDTVLLKLQNNINIGRARVLKRSFDIVVSMFILSISFPIMLGLAWLVRRDGGPAMYGHKRIGRDGKAFSCLKFRSMVLDGDAILEKHLQANAEAAAEWESTRKLTKDPRVTAIGEIIRKTSLDELPQLINVLKGEMSLVGPRPIVQQEVVQYGDQFPYYLTMTPGITGLWQTSGRSDTTYGERVLLDVWYARNWCLWHDLVILLRTVPALLAKEGAR